MWKSQANAPEGMNTMLKPVNSISILKVFVFHEI